jgi:hypothetical protein
MKYTFFCERPIDAFYLNGTKHACACRGIFNTSDENLGLFLATYPGVSLLSKEEDKPAAIDAGQYPQCPEPVVVINGGFSGGGAMAIKPKKQ